MIDIEALKPQIEALAKKYGLSAVVLFGSQATGATHPKSDVDIAILGARESDETKIFCGFYDIFARNDVEIINLEKAPPTIMYVVVRDGKLIYENKTDAFFKWKLYAMWVWRDTAWLRQLRDKKMIEWAKAA